MSVSVPPNRLSKLKVKKYLFSFKPTSRTHDPQGNTLDEDYLRLHQIFICSSFVQNVLAFRELI